MINLFFKRKDGFEIIIVDTSGRHKQEVGLFQEMVEGIFFYFPIFVEVFLFEIFPHVQTHCDLTLFFQFKMESDLIRLFL